jgi:hypothetical protein
MAENNIPAKDGEFDMLFGNVVTYVDDKTSGAPPVWNHIPAADIQNLRNVCGAWTAAYEPTKAPHTPPQTAEKNRVRKTSEKTLREFVNRFLRYDPVTDEDRDNMGIHNKKNGRSPIPVPTTSLQLTIDTGTRRRVIVHYKDEKSGRRAKPAGVHGIEVRWALLDRPPASIKELVNSSFDTNPPLILEFDEEDRGKHIYMAGAWEIQREGEKGPHGAIEEAIVP